MTEAVEMLEMMIPTVVVICRYHHDCISEHFFFVVTTIPAYFVVMSSLRLMTIDRRSRMRFWGFKVHVWGSQSLVETRAKHLSCNQAPKLMVYIVGTGTMQDFLPGFGDLSELAQSLICKFANLEARPISTMVHADVERALTESVEPECPALAVPNSALLGLEQFGRMGGVRWICFAYPSGASQCCEA